ncbi:MAG: DUF4835 family protein [Chitinophagaceae bacterium]|nr:MAG: DUF4835 family protein [Chitinophagaceae bacterium]
MILSKFPFFRFFKRAFLIMLFLPFFSLEKAEAQELNMSVQVIARQLQSTDPQVFQTLETSIREFMNTRRWTGDNFSVQERIECGMVINITEELSGNSFKAQVTIQSSRPVHNASYNTVLLNHNDRDWVFEYIEHQPIEFNPNSFTNNLSALLGFYAYLIIGMDYDSFSPRGGDPYFDVAQNIIGSIPPNLDAPGWKPFESNRNRYWIIENLQNSRYVKIRESFYQYHLEGLDLMYENTSKGRENILQSLRNMEQSVVENPNTMISTMFFNAKSDELVNIFSGAPQPEKAQAIQLLYRMDSGNTSKYSRILR